MGSSPAEEKRHPQYLCAWFRHIFLFIKNCNCVVVVHENQIRLLFDISHASHSSPVKESMLMGLPCSDPSVAKTRNCITFVKANPLVIERTGSEKTECSGQLINSPGEKWMREPDSDLLPPSLFDWHRLSRRRCSRG